MICSKQQNRSARQRQPSLGQLCIWGMFCSVSVMRRQQQMQPRKPLCWQSVLQLNSSRPAVMMSATLAMKADVPTSCPRVRAPQLGPCAAYSFSPGVPCLPPVDEAGERGDVSLHKLTSANISSAARAPPAAAHCALEINHRFTHCHCGGAKSGNDKPLQTLAHDRHSSSIQRMLEACACHP